MTLQLEPRQQLPDVTSVAVGRYDQFPQSVGTSSCRTQNVKRLSRRTLALLGFPFTTSALGREGFVQRHDNITDNLCGWHNDKDEGRSKTSKFCVSHKWKPLEWDAANAFLLGDAVKWRDKCICAAHRPKIPKGALQMMYADYKSLLSCQIQQLRGFCNLILVFVEPISLLVGVINGIPLI